MKKYFLFDNEPITGWNYFFRLLVGQLLIIIIIGFWLIAATAYKRSGTFNWSNETRIICSIIIPINVIISVMADEIEFNDTGFLLFTILIGIVHLVLLFKNGNKSNNIFEQ